MFRTVKTLLFLIFVLSCNNVNAAVYYVRSSGGTGTQCTGLANVNYDGSGSGEACALNHPDWVMPMEENSTESEDKVNSSGDMIVIVNGSYRIGCKDGVDCVNASYNSNTGDCNTSATYDCDPRPVSDNITIIGCSTSGCGCTYGWGGAVTCTTTRPELWGAGNVQEVIDVSDSTGVTIKDIEITDRENCNTFTPFTCRNGGDMSDPDKLSAQFGINASSASNLTLTGVNLHGVGYEGIRVNNVSTLTITGSNIDYAAVGMNNDTDGSCTTCGLSGNITISKTSMNGHGCIEDWENDGTIVANTCCSQEHGCSSAESISMSNTGGTWILTDSDFSYNTADGIDLLYLNRGIYAGLGSVTAKRIRAEGNAGNSIKGPNDMYVEDSFLIANCSYFQDQTKTYSSGTFDHCRANGHPVSVEFKSGDNSTPILYNNTIASNGDGVLLTTGECTTGIDFIAQGNVFLGGREWFTDTENPLAPDPDDDYTSIYFDSDPACNPDFVENYNTFVGDFKEGDPHTGANSIFTTTLSDVFSGTAKQGPYDSPGYFTDINYNAVLYLKAGSSALGVSNEAGDDSNDFNSFARGAAWDGGAVEYGSVAGSVSTATPLNTGGIRITGAIRITQ